MRTTRFRRRTATTLALALGASVLGFAAAPAGAATTPATCSGRDAATTGLLNTLAQLGGSPPPAGQDATLTVDVDVASNAPQAVDTAQVFDVAFTPQVILPASLLASLQSFGITGADVADQVTTIDVTNATPSSFSSPATSQSIVIPATGPVNGTVTSPAFTETLTATGPDQSTIGYKLNKIVFDVFVPASPLGPLNLALQCIPNSSDGFASTEILQPGPPVVQDAGFDVPLGGSKTIVLDVKGNPALTGVSVTTPGTLGAASIAEGLDGKWRLTYVHDAANGAGTDTVGFTATNGFDGGSSTPGTVTINVLDNACEVGASGSCSLFQVIEVDVEGTTLSMQQAGGGVVLEDVTLDGSPQSTTGALNNVTVKDARGDGAGWSLTGQVTDFKTDSAVGDCPRSTPASWDYRCIPGNNLGWAPAGVVAHEVIPGDVATVEPGEASDSDDIAAGVAGSGLESSQSLCSAPATRNGGTFVCGAGLGLLIPASASAGTYSATLTLTLA